MEEDLGARPQGFTESGKSGGNDHKLLDIQIIVRVLPAIDDVHQGNWQDFRVRSAQIPVQGHVQGIGRGPRDGHRNTENRVGAKIGFVAGAIPIDHQHIN